MPKTNFSKTEIALDEMLQKMTKAKLLELADSAMGQSLPTPSERLKTIQILQLELRFLFRNFKEIFKTLNIDKKWLKSITQNTEQLTEEEWVKVVEMKVLVDSQIKKVTQSISDDDLIELERKKHINKRFNVNTKWLPLK